MKGKCSVFITILHPDGTVHTLFIIIIASLVFIKRKLGIGSGINEQCYVAGLFFVGILKFGTDRKNRTCLNKKRDPLVRGLGFNLLPTGCEVAVIEIIPPSSGWKVK